MIFLARIWPATTAICLVLYFENLLEIRYLMNQSPALNGNSAIGVSSLVEILHDEVATVLRNKERDIASLHNQYRNCLKSREMGMSRPGCCGSLESRTPVLVFKATQAYTGLVYSVDPLD